MIGKENKKNSKKQEKIIFPEKEKIFEILKKKIKKNSKIIVAVSGGPDSMLTAKIIQDFFMQYTYTSKNLYFVHFNHKIRKESDQEEAFIKNFFKEKNLICISHHGGKIGNLTEEKLRNRRYDQLQKIAKKHDIDYIILGHNLSDRIESTFLNLLRGANLKGFLSIQCCEPHHLLGGIKVLRPLIELPKSKIIEICKKNNIPYIIDTSNNNEKISIRNKLRNKILPKLYTLIKNGKGKEKFEQSMANIYQEIEKQKKNTQSQILNLKPIKKSPYRKANFAYERNIEQKKIKMDNIIKILNKLGIYKNVSSAFLNELLKFLKTANTGYKYFQKTYFFIAHGKIYIIQAPKNFRKKYIKDKEKIEKEIYRYPQKNDKIKGKTRNQYCINQKIPIFRRNFIPILEKKNKILKIKKDIMEI